MGTKVNIKTILSGFFAGFSFRQKVENDPQGDLPVIQMKDLEHNYSNISINVTKIKSDKVSNKNFLQKGDVLLITKGANNYAVEYKHEFKKAVASSAFYVLRPNQKKINSSYLAWYINQSPVQQYFKSNMAGTYIPNINKGTIEGIEIELPTLQVQDYIVKINELRNQERFLSEAIIDKREQVVNQLLLKFSKDESML